MKKLIHGENLLPKEAISLFKKMILPAGTYGAEAQGSTVNCKMTKTFKKLPFEIVVMYFCKYVLGVRKQTTNAAVRGDLGIFLFFIDIIIAMVKYYK